MAGASRTSIASATMRKSIHSLLIFESDIVLISETDGVAACKAERIGRRRIVLRSRFYAMRRSVDTSDGLADPSARFAVEQVDAPHARSKGDGLARSYIQARARHACDWMPRNGRMYVGFRSGWLHDLHGSSNR